MKISAIVPVFNEDKNIEHVLKSLLKSYYIDEIICINDGSTDNSYQMLKQYRNIILVNLLKNHGKAYAIARGILKAKGEVVVFIDGDLKGLSDKHFRQFIYPLESKKYRVSIGYLPDRFDKFMRQLSGTRAYFKNDLLPYINEIKKRGYGLELYLNYIQSCNKTKYFPIYEVKHATKFQKLSFKTSAKLIMLEATQILKELSRQKKPVENFLKLNKYLKKYLYTSKN